MIYFEQRSASGRLIKANLSHLNPTRFRSIFADEFDPVRGVHSLAIIDVGADDQDRIESRSDALELDLCGCLDSGL